MVALAMRQPRISHAGTGACILALLIANAPTAARADPRTFVYTYEATTLPEGQWELEHWATWRHHGGGRERFDFRHEFEYGVTDRFQVSLYLANWRHEESGGEGRTTFESSALSAMVNLTDPVSAPLGSALYGEIYLGPELVELEGIAILQKNLGPWVIGANSAIESEWEGDDLGALDEVKGELKQTIGISYQVAPSFLVGLEGALESEIDGWEDLGDPAIYVGPNASYRNGRFFITAAALWQASDVAGEPDFQTRIITGFNF